MLFVNESFVIEFCFLKFLSVASQQYLLSQGIKPCSQYIRIASSILNKKLGLVAEPPLAFVIKTLGVVFLTKAKKQSHHKDLWVNV